MQLTKGAIGNLINRYKAVLKKCHLMNTFGSLAVAGMLIMGGAGMAVAAEDVALEGKNKNVNIFMAAFPNLSRFNIFSREQCIPPFKNMLNEIFPPAIKD